MNIAFCFCHPMKFDPGPQLPNNGWIQGKTSCIFTPLAQTICPQVQADLYPYKQKRRQKVVTAAWGTELIQFPATIAILHQDNWKNWKKSSYSSNRPAWWKIASAARNWSISVPQAAATTFAFSSAWTLLHMVEADLYPYTVVPSHFYILLMYF